MVHRIFQLLIVFTVMVVFPGRVWAQAGEPSPEDAGAMVRALTDAWLGNNEAALTTLSALESRHPVASIYAATADVYADMGRDLDAQNALERAATAGPDALPYRVRIGTMHFEQGRVAEAEVTYQAVLDQDENNSGALLGLARIAERQGDIMEARRLLDRANATSPTIESLDFAAALEAKPNVVVRDAEHTATPEPDNNMPSTGASVEEVLRRLEDRPREVEAWNDALEALALHPHPRAISLAEDALLLFPDRPNLVIPAAEILVENGQEMRAISAVTPFLDPSMDAEDALLARGWSVVVIGQSLDSNVDNSPAALEMISVLAPESLAFWHAKGHADLAQENENAALDAWTKALALQPDHEVIASHLNE